MIAYPDNDQNRLGQVRFYLHTSAVVGSPSVVDCCTWGWVEVFSVPPSRACFCPAPPPSIPTALPKQTVGGLTVPLPEFMVVNA